MIRTIDHISRVLTFVEPFKSGSVATVSKALYLPTTSMVAVKTFYKNRQDMSPVVHEDIVCREVKHLHLLSKAQQQHAKHKEARVQRHVPQWIDAIQDENAVYLLQELISFGTLQEALQESTFPSNDRKSKTMNMQPSYVKAIILQLLQGVHFCHQNRICHGDLKPANVMFAHLREPELRLVDFGSSQVIPCMPAEPHDYERFTGKSCVYVLHPRTTPHYAAPEVMEEHCFSFASDVWSLGRILQDLDPSGSLGYRALAEDLFLQKNPMRRLTLAEAIRMPEWHKANMDESG